MSAIVDLVQSTGRGITSQFEYIGPKEAARILMNVHPRQVGRNHLKTIDLYARQQEDGSWNEDVVQTISISNRGELIDGWHRLHAILKSGKTYRFLVVRGVPSEAFSKYDSGKARTLAFRSGLDKETAAIASMLLRLCNHGSGNRASTMEEVSVAIDFIRPELSLFNSIAASTRKRKLTTASVQVGCLLRMKAHPSVADQIARNFHYLQCGDITEAPRIVGVLYRRLLEENNPPMVAFSLAWMAFDPTRVHNSKLQLRPITAELSEIRSGVLEPLVMALK